MSSGAANLGPTNPALISGVQSAAADYRVFNRLPATQAVPVDAVTSSGSGLDPEISIANARLQAPRVAAARGVPLGQVRQLINAATVGRVLDVMGQPGVNVLDLNLSLTRLGTR
jgi:K+-transporting ATPase ATPase C chain